MLITPQIREEIKEVFNERQAPVLIKAIDEAYNTLVKVSDFRELKEVTAELAASQMASEKRLNHIDVTLAELAQAQKRTEQRLEKLIEAQERTEQILQQVVIGLDDLRQEVGGLSKSVSYGFENEAYRMVSDFLKERYGIVTTEKFIRKDIDDKEINLFGKGKRNGQDVLIVGEAKLRLDERRRKRRGRMDVFEQLEDKVKTVRKSYPDIEIVKVLLTHYATTKFLTEAQDKGVIVIQSYEW